MKELWVVRHTAVDVPQGTCYGATDVPLKSTFMDEARMVSERLLGIEPTIVLSSPLSRALKLAKAVGYSMPQIDFRLREQDFGAWEMLLYDEITDPQLQHWYKDYVYEKPTGGESFVHVVERVGGLIEELRERPETAFLAFAHGGIQMAVGAYLGFYPMLDAPNYVGDYGSVFRYQI